MLRSCARVAFATCQPWLSSPTRFLRGTRTSSKNTSLTSKPPSMSWMGRSVTRGVSIEKSSIEMPSTAGRIRSNGASPATCRIRDPASTEIAVPPMKIQ